MSSSGEISLAAPPNTFTLASEILASMAALSGVATDYNEGSQIRTFAEATGAVGEQQSVWSQALAYQAMVYGALQLFNITPNVAIAASGMVTFQTSASGSPPPASQNVPIPAGTLVQTNGGTQFVTSAAATLLSGTGAINVPVIAVVSGSAGNVPATAIANIVTGLIYPLFVTNANRTTGGTDAESASAALARFAAAVGAIGLSSPVAIADAAIGVTVGNESVIFSTLYEPWIAAGSGAGSGQAGWQLYIDNGSGTASSGLIAAVNSKLTGGTVSGASNASGATGYRDAGVPYNIFAVTPTVANVGVSGIAVPGATIANLNQTVENAVNAYFTLPFGTAAQQAAIAAEVANSVFGQLSSLTVSLYTSGGPLTSVTTSPSGRVTLGTLAVSIVSGS